MIRIQLNTVLFYGAKAVILEQEYNFIPSFRSCLVTGIENKNDSGFQLLSFL